MSPDFEKFAAKGNEFIKLVADDLEVPRDKAGRIVRAVLHALRNRISHEESLQLLAQLPMAIKAVYVDRWTFKKEFRRIGTLAEFLDEVRQEDDRTAGYDFGNDARARQAVSAVFRALHYFVSEGELDDLADTLPAELKDFIRHSLSGNKTVL